MFKRKRGNPGNGLSERLEDKYGKDFIKTVTNYILNRGSTKVVGHRRLTDKLETVTALVSPPVPRGPATSPRCALFYIGYIQSLSEITTSLPRNLGGLLRPSCAKKRLAISIWPRHQHLAIWQDEFIKRGFRNLEYNLFAWPAIGKTSHHFRSRRKLHL